MKKVILFLTLTLFAVFAFSQSNNGNFKRVKIRSAQTHSRHPASYSQLFVDMGNGNVYSNDTNVSPAIFATSIYTSILGARIVSTDTFYYNVLTLPDIQAYYNYIENGAIEGLYVDTTDVWEKISNGHDSLFETSYSKYGITMVHDTFTITDPGMYSVDVNLTFSVPAAGSPRFAFSIMWYNGSTVKTSPVMHIVQEMNTDTLNKTSVHYTITQNFTAGNKVVPAIKLLSTGTISLDAQLNIYSAIVRIRKEN